MLKRLRHALQLIQITITTSSIHFTGGTSTNIYIRLYLLLLRLRLSRLYSLHSCNHFASEGWKGENGKAKAKDDFLLNIMTLWIWKGKTHYNQCRTKNNIGNGSASQMVELFRECLFNLGIRDIFIFNKVSNFLDRAHFNTLLFWTFSYTLQGVF